jgi:hypothetical protein
VPGTTQKYPQPETGRDQEQGASHGQPFTPRRFSHTRVCRFNLLVGSARCRLEVQ